jgi:hypothetical protein
MCEEIVIFARKFSIRKIMTTCEILLLVMAVVVVAMGIVVAVMMWQSSRRRKLLCRRKAIIEREEREVERLSEEARREGVDFDKLKVNS